MVINRGRTESGATYATHFTDLRGKITQYKIEPRHIYSMDEMSFSIDVTCRTKREPTNRSRGNRKFLPKKALENHSIEKISIHACICADGTDVPPCVNFKSRSGKMMSNWIDDMDPDIHPTYLISSKSGRPDNNIGVAWLQKIFDRHTKEKADGSHRLLILDGRASHLTPQFAEYCHRSKIFLAIMPSHSSHTLQPLDAGVFAQLSAAYAKQVSAFRKKNFGWTPMKDDWFVLFWNAYTSAVTEENILKSFEITGVQPLDSNAVLKRARSRDGDA